MEKGVIAPVTVPGILLQTVPQNKMGHAPHLVSHDPKDVHSGPEMSCVIHQVCSLWTSSVHICMLSYINFFSLLCALCTFNLWLCHSACPRHCSYLLCWLLVGLTVLSGHPHCKISKWLPAEGIASTSSGGQHSPNGPDCTEVWQDPDSSEVCVGIGITASNSGHC